MRVVQYFGLFLAVFGGETFGGKLGKNLDGKLGGKSWWKKYNVGKIQKFAGGKIKEVAELSDDMKAKIAAKKEEYKKKIAAKKEEYKQKKAEQMTAKLEKGEITEEQFKAWEDKAEKKFDFAAKKAAVKEIMEEKLANGDITPEQFDEWKNGPKNAAKKWKASVGKAKKALKKKAKKAGKKTAKNVGGKWKKNFAKYKKNKAAKKAD